MFYVGRTKRRLLDRLAEHKYAIRRGNEEYPMAKHFKLMHNSNPSILRIQGIDHINITIRKGNRELKLNQRETFWIYKLKANMYPGLNEDLDFTHFLDRFLFFSFEVVFLNMKICCIF